MKSRLGIYVINNKSDNIEGYRSHYIKMISRVLDKLVVVFSEPLREEEMRNVSAECPIEFIRGEGKNLLQNYYTGLYPDQKPAFSEFDCAVLMEDSVFGPFYPFESMFDKMDRLSFDFWGITKQDPQVDEHERDIAEHIQPYFICIEKELLQSVHFKEFWNAFNDEIELNGNNTQEEFITTYFAQSGYQWDSYVSTSAWRSGRPANNLDWSLYVPFEMIRDKQCPILRKACFSSNSGLKHSLGLDLRRAADYIERHRDYDMDLIWDHLLRTISIDQIKKTMHLEFVLSDAFSQCGKQHLRSRKTAILLHLYYEDLYDEGIRYMTNIPDFIDIFVSTTEKGKALLERKLQQANIKYCAVLTAGDRGRDAGALLVTFAPYAMAYENLCFVHDKKSAGGAYPSVEGNSFRHIMWDNLLCSENYILNVLDLMASNKRLGLLAPPQPIMGGYFIGVLGDEWTVCFEETAKLAEKLKLNVKIEKENRPFALSTSFWCKTSAMRPILEHKWEFGDFPEEPLKIDGTMNHAIERIFEYVAQSEGYYSGIVMNPEYASVYVNHAIGELGNVINEVHQIKPVKYPLTMNTMVKVKDIIDLHHYCTRYDKILIYGAGLYAKYMLNILKLIEIKPSGFIVTSIKNNPTEIEGYPVLCWNDIQASVKGAGIIIAMNEKNQLGVIKSLTGSEADYYCFKQEQVK